MRFEETGELVENLDRKYVLGRGGYLRFHFHCLCQVSAAGVPMKNG
jgi:hypothetical protein